MASWVLQVPKASPNECKELMAGVVQSLIKTLQYFNLWNSPPIILSEMRGLVCECAASQLNHEHQVEPLPVD
uniref:Uncharacterized protein n=1 Tax=Anguilla anguilla TaxID=7936 RepID=A0A0E9U616_ANGAN